MRKVALVCVLLVTFAISLPVVMGQDSSSFPEPDLTSAAAPFIYTWHYAVQQGATPEWHKQEGVVVDAANKKLYVAVARVGDRMSDAEGDLQLTGNPCGVVYVADLDEQWNVAELKPLVVGGPYDEAANQCHPDNISEPDNIFVDPAGNLWIGEDTGLHQNNMLWKYDITSGELRRFATVPTGAEVTGLRITDDGTVFMNVQHPDPYNIYPYDHAVIGVVVGFNAADSFESLPLPSGEAVLTVNVAAGDYQVLGRAGDPIPNNADNQLFGQFLNLAGATALANGETYCNNPDGNMFLPTDAIGKEGYLYSNFECRPGGVSKLHIRQNDDGTWSVLAGEMVDFAAAHGTWNNCNASITPWNTGLTSEENAPRSADAWLGSGYVMDEYLGGVANPYDYGYIIELVPTATGTDVIRHYAMGRRNNEQATVMGDAMTVYFGDDGDSSIFYKFVADEPSNLSAGTLYAAKITQQGATTTDDYSFQIEWIELGHGNDAEIEAAVRALDAPTGG